MDEQLTLIFLVFIVVMISAMVYKLPMNAINMALLVGVLSTFLISNTSKKESSYESECNHMKFVPPRDEITIYHSRVENDNEEPNEETKKDAYDGKGKERKCKKDSDTALYNNYNSTKEVYYDMACPGDNALFDRMLEQGKRPQQATDARAKFDKYSMLQYLDEELNSTANSRWWDDDSLEHLF
jgi:hypothetical protein